MIMNRYKVETDLPFHAVASALEGKNPKVLILTIGDGAPQTTNVTVGGVTTNHGPRKYTLGPWLVVISVVIWLFVIGSML